MLILALGIIAFFAFHGLKIHAPAARAKLSARLGEGPAKGLMGLLLLASVFLIVRGWKLSEPIPLYDLGVGARHAAFLLVSLAFILFAASALGRNIKRWVRHPQLTAVKLWAVAHLLANGDSRSLLLFGGLLIWAITAVIGINRRDGPREPQPPAGFLGDAAAVGAGLVVASGVIAVHPWLFGVSPLPVP